MCELYRRMVFNVIARNQDGHVKNISFLMNQSGECRLSPAYDVTFAYNPNGLRTSRHQMTINGKLDNITYDDLIQSAESMSIGHKKADAIIAEVEDAVKKCPEFAEIAFLSEEQMEYVSDNFWNVR